MITIENPKRARAICNDARTAGRLVALVPTMGAIHFGHLALVDEAKRRGDFVVASVFVNPTQFGPTEDLTHYPRDMEGDIVKLSERGVDLLFTPRAEEMYEKGHLTSVNVAGLTEGLCGPYRPGHFEGVATVVTKLLNIVGPCAAVFGRKDYQQLQVIKRLVSDLLLPVEVVEIPTVRDPDGLAMSSRNQYLSPEDRTRARALFLGLTGAHALFESGIRDVGRLRLAIATLVEAAADSVDYVTAADPDTLEALDDNETCQDRLLLASAATIGGTRLIDNAVLGEDFLPSFRDTAGR